jgi:hypothetical protein
VRPIARWVVAAMVLWGVFGAPGAFSLGAEPPEAAGEAEKARRLDEKMAAETPPGTGFEGIVVREGEVIVGARVYAYRTFADVMAHRPVTVSAPTIEDGSWKLDLPRGKYFLLAKRRKAGAKDGPLAVGDDFAYHGSNPITIAPGKYTHVGFSIATLESETAYEEIPDKASGVLAGVVTLKGKPVEGVNVLLYLEDTHDFRGMAFSSSPPTRADGMFRFDFLPAADYYVLARKRATGKGAGPLADGDIFGFYVVNPVPVKAGSATRIRFGVISKAGEIGKEDSLFRDTGTYVTGKILDRDGKPVKGVYAFAYTDKSMANRRPDHISRPVDAAGRYVIHLPQGGKYFIGTRSEYGDTPGPGEWYGRYEGTPDHSVRLTTGIVLEKIDMVVERILR